MWLNMQSHFESYSPISNVAVQIAGQVIMTMTMNDNDTDNEMTFTYYTHSSRGHNTLYCI